MGQKDIAEKMLADHNDVFADIVNVLLFGGKQVVKPEELQNTKDKQQLKIADEIHEEERDVCKTYKKQNIRIAMIGLEHQTDVDKDEPFRVIGYDGVSYKSQLLEGKERYPVVTLVLYFGTDKKWDKPTSLYEALDISDEWKPFVNDYRINLFQIAFLSDEQAGMFSSDFRFVADFFIQRRKNRKYIASREEIRHVDEVLKLMHVLTGDTRFEKAQNRKDGKEIRSMCEVFDEYEERGRAEGRAEGKIEVYYNELHLSVKEISKKLGMEESEVSEIVSKLSSHD